MLADAGAVLSLDFSAEALDRCEESGRFTLFLLARSLLKPAVRELILPSGLEIRPRYLTPENFPELGKACLPYPEMESLDLSNMSGLTEIELLHPIEQRSMPGEHQRANTRAQCSRIFARKRAIDWLCNWQTRDSVTPSTAAISFRFMSCS